MNSSNSYIAAMTIQWLLFFIYSFTFLFIINSRKERYSWQGDRHSLQNKSSVADQQFNIITLFMRRDVFSLKRMSKLQRSRAQVTCKCSRQLSPRPSSNSVYIALDIWLTVIKETSQCADSWKYLGFYFRHKAHHWKCFTSWDFSVLRSEVYI